MELVSEVGEGMLIGPRSWIAILFSARFTDNGIVVPFTHDSATIVDYDVYYIHPRAERQYATDVLYLSKHF